MKRICNWAKRKDLKEGLCELKKILEELKKNKK